MNIIIRCIKLFFFRIKWVKKNRHNTTVPRRIFDETIVSVGRFSYGPLNVFSYGNPNEKLIIGDFVSISSDVKFILGGNHAINNILTFPFKVKLYGQDTEASTKGPIIIEDDVWIGMNSLILSGVRIGQGAVVAAGSVVTKDIPAYSIVGGNPAKIIRYRFNSDTVNKLKNINFKKIDVDFIKKNIEVFYKDVDDKLYKEFYMKLDD